MKTYILEREETDKEIHKLKRVYEIKATSLEEAKQKLMDGDFEDDSLVQGSEVYLRGETIETDNGSIRLHKTV